MNDRSLYSEKVTARGRSLATMSLVMARKAAKKEMNTRNDIVLDEFKDCLDDVGS